MERPDGVPHGPGGTPEGGRDLRGLLPGRTSEQDLGPAEGERDGRPKAPAEGVLLGSRQFPDEQRWLHPVRVAVTGSFHSRSIETALSLGHDGTGRRVRRTVYGATKGEVAEKLRALQAEHDAGRLVEAEQLTAGEYLTRWLNNTAKESVGAATWEGYRQLVELYLVPTLGGMRLHKLRPLHVEQCYAAMKAGAAGRKPAGASTRKHAGVILSAALRHAVRTGVIPSNSAADVKKAREPAREMASMTPAQARQFLGAAKANQNHALFSLALGTGMRQGELLALHWSDVDLATATLNVRRSLSQVKGVFALKEPKSKTSRRAVTLPMFALRALQDHRAAALKAGRVAAPVFPIPPGATWTRRTSSGPSGRSWRTPTRRSRGGRPRPGRSRT
ncbi:MAG: hypothetical protein C0501_30665 [Isosphaera sp.]|nr:hypothetical protein [Isosphaera sp.]